LSRAKVAGDEPGGYCSHQHLYRHFIERAGVRDVLNNMFRGIILIMKMLESLRPYLACHFLGSGTDEAFGIVDCYVGGVDLFDQGFGEGEAVVEGEHLHTIVNIMGI
jgi:hypothetical protein